LEFVKGARQRAGERAAKIRSHPKAKEIATKSRRLLQDGRAKKVQNQKIRA
jgi:hypothetical protein